MLCLGAGYGAVVESVAPHCRQVVVLEPDAAWLHFVSQRVGIFNAEDDGVLLRAAAGQPLPFASGSFDAVVMAESVGNGGPARLLGEARRVLRAGGQVLVIADNRFSLALPSGWWDRWNAAPQPLPLLVRTFGLLRAWARRQNGPEALPTLCRRLSELGFAGIRNYGLWPSRRQFDDVIPLYGRRPAALPGKPPSWRQRLKQHGLFLPAHCVTAWAGGEPQPTSYERIYAAAARQIAGGQDAAPLLALRHILTRKDKMIVLAMRHAEPVIVRIPFSRAAAAAEARHAAALVRLADTHPGLAPSPLAAGQIDGFDYRVETALPGAAQSTVRDRVGAEAVLRRAAGLLDVMNPAASLVRAPLAGAVYERLVEARLERLFQLVRERDQQVGLRAFFRDRLSGVSLTFGLVHGDFSRSNIYLDGDNAGVVDWEAADFDDLPILDAIGFLESVLRPLGARRSLAE
ncbi:MAG: phosphotransferase, partial [Kiloniellaceae bacterium]